MNLKITKIALSGALGKMGKVVTDLVNARNDCEISVGVDAGVDSPIKLQNFTVYKKIFDIEKEPFDVIIDFSHPSALTDLLSFCKIKNTPLMAATTGYNKEQISQIKIASSQVPIFFSWNMSLGINLLQDLAKRAVRVLGEQFDVEIVEKHHNLKKDAPSGTALMLADSVNDEYKGKKHTVYDRHSMLKSREKDEIGIHSVRGGTIVGEHEIIFAGHHEIISLSHSALSKEVFAVGAINAAIFLKGQPNGLYDMSDLLVSC